jgi:hypothetical protein
MSPEKATFHFSGKNIEERLSVMKCDLELNF